VIPLCSLKLCKNYINQVAEFKVSIHLVRPHMSTAIGSNPSYGNLYKEKNRLCLVAISRVYKIKSDSSKITVLQTKLYLK
jgi:hypothetical protein